MRLLWLVLLLLILQARQQVSANDTLFRTVQHFTNADGLPQNSIKAIAQDEAGFTWIATEGGLTRYDGYQFQNFTAKQFKLQSNRFSMLISCLEDGKLYAINDQRKTLAIYQGKPTYDSLCIPKMHSSLQSRLVSAGQKGLDYNDLLIGENGTWQTGETTIVPTKRGSLYLTTSTIYSFYRGNQLVFEFPYRKRKEDQLFLLSDQLFSFNARTGQFYTFGEAGMQKTPVIGLPGYHSFAKMQLLWNQMQPDYALLCYDQSLYQLKPERGKIIAKKIAENFDGIQEGIVSIWFDHHSQKLLLGSLGNGLFILSNRVFQATSPNLLATQRVYYAQTLLDSHTILTGQGHIFEPPLRTPQTSLSYLQKITDRYSLFTDEQGYVWTKRNSTVYRFLPNTSSQISSWSFPKAVTQIFSGQQSTLVSLQDGSISRISHSQNDTTFLFRLPAEATTMTQDGDFIWFGTTSGLYQYQVQEKQYSLVPASAGKSIRNIYAENKRIWVSTYGDGFFLVDKNKWICFPLDYQQYLSNAHCILEDQQGFLWITTNNGLFQVKKNDLLAYADQPVFQPYYHYYNIEDGLQTNEFNGGCTPCGIAMPDGMFSFPTINGLVWFSPTTARSVMPHNAIFIDKLLVDKQEVPFTTSLELPRNMHQLRVEINTPFLGNRENLHFNYAMTREGEEPIWMPVENDVITFANIPAGNYTLEIRKLNGFGPNNYTALKLSLHVPQHWLLRPISLFLIAAILLTAGFLLYRSRTRYIRRSNKLLESKVAKQTQHIQQTLKTLTQSQQELVQQSEWQQKMLAVLSHDIKAPLKYLMLATDRIRQGIQNDNITPYQEPTKTVYEYSSRLYYTMDNLLQYVKTQLAGGVIEKTCVDVYHLVEEKRLIFKDIAAGLETVIKNHVALGIKAQTNQPLLAIILHNLIDNGVKVTENGVVLIEATDTTTGTIIEVADSGIGMTDKLVLWFNQNQKDDDSLTDANPSGSGIGLYIVKGLADLLEITISVQSCERGTRFKLFIPH